METGEDEDENEKRGEWPPLILIPVSRPPTEYGQYHYITKETFCCQSHSLAMSKDSGMYYL